MSLDKIRYSLTVHTVKFFFKYENFRLLIHPSVENQYDLLNRLSDDINLMPKIKDTKDGMNIKFYIFDYPEEIYSKSELLAFIFASINNDWNIAKGINLLTCKVHFWLEHSNIIYDPSLSVITKNELFYKRYKKFKEITNDKIIKYLIDNNNLQKFYEKGLHMSKSSDYSVNFIKKIQDEFYLNVSKEYELDEKRIEEIKKHFMVDDFMELRQVLSQKRKSFLKNGNIGVHPSIDEHILEVIEKNANKIKLLMKQEYDMNFDYFYGTLGNCYALSILFHLFDDSFKLVQGGLPYKEYVLGEEKNEFYQHSWLEKDDIVYDPALRIVTPKELYYLFVQKQTEYSETETENILRRIGFNLTHFQDFMNGIQIGNDETIRYRALINEIDSAKNKVEGEKLIKTLRIKH